MNSDLYSAIRFAACLLLFAGEAENLPDPVHFITTIYRICIDVSFQRVIIKIDERGDTT